MSTAGGDDQVGWASPGQQAGYPPAYPPPASQPPAQPPGYPQPGYAAPGYAQPSYAQPSYAQPSGWGQPYGGAAAALQPGIIPLRPLSVGEVLDGSITLTRRNPRATLAVSAVIAAVLALISFGLQQITTDPTTGTGVNLLVTLLSRIITLVATLVVAGFVTAVAGQAVLGRPITLEQVWAKVRPRFWTILGASVVVGLITVVSLVGLLVAALLPFTFYAFVTPVILLENSEAMPSLKRSRALVKGAFWRTLGILLLATLIAGVLAFIFLIPFVVVIALSDGHFSTTATSSSSTLALVLLDIGTAFASTLTLPFAAGVHALLYVDQRMRVEGLDVSLRQAAAEAQTR